MRKLQALAVTLVVLLGLIGFGNPALAETYVDSFSNQSNHDIYVQSDNAGNNTIGPGGNGSISFNNNLYVYGSEGGEELGYLKVTGNCNIDAFNIEAYTDATGNNQTNCYGVEIFSNGVHIEATYSDDNGLSTSNS